jgi:hypothetical protein
MSYIKSIHVQLDDETIARIDQATSPGRSARADFIRQAIRAALNRIEFDRIEESYRREPQVFVGGDWDGWLEWNPEVTEPQR